MINKVFALISFMLLSAVGFSQTMVINKDIEVNRISDKVYVYTAWAEIGKWGRVGSNGLFIIDKGDALMVDTPFSEEQTIELVKWVEDSLNVKIKSFVPGHWHEDCVAGMDYLNKRGVKSYANKMTNDILKSKNLPLAKQSFSDSLALKLNNVDVKCYYLGGGHSTDNIVVWIPSQKVLFGGCMLKDCSTNNLGNTSDAAMAEWLPTVKQLQNRFSSAKNVIPGHGKPGGMEIIDHTIDLLQKQ